MRIYQLRISWTGPLRDSKFPEVIDAVLDPSGLYNTLDEAKRAAATDLHESDMDEFLPLKWEQGPSNKWQASVDDEWGATIYETEI